MEANKTNIFLKGESPTLNGYFENNSWVVFLKLILVFSESQILCLDW